MICDEFNYYDNNQEEITRNHINEFVVIKNRQVCGYYELEMDAFKSMVGNELGTFMVKRCQKPGTDVIEYFNNAVTFA